MGDYDYFHGRKYWSRRNSDGEWTSGAAGVVKRILTTVKDLKLPSIEGNYSASEKKSLRSKRRKLAQKMIDQGHSADHIRSTLGSDPKKWPEIKNTYKPLTTPKKPAVKKAVQKDPNAFSDSKKIAENLKSMGEATKFLKGIKNNPSLTQDQKLELGNYLSKKFLGKPAVKKTAVPKSAGNEDVFHSSMVKVDQIKDASIAGGLLGWVKNHKTLNDQQKADLEAAIRQKFPQIGPDGKADLSKNLKPEGELDKGEIQFHKLWGNVSKTTNSTIAQGLYEHIYENKDLKPQDKSRLLDRLVGKFPELRDYKPVVPNSQKPDELVDEMKSKASKLKSTGDANVFLKAVRDDPDLTAYEKKQIKADVLKKFPGAEGSVTPNSLKPDIDPLLSKKKIAVAIKALSASSSTLEVSQVNQMVQADKSITPEDKKAFQDLAEVKKSSANSQKSDFKEKYFNLLKGDAQKLKNSPDAYAFLEKIGKEGALTSDQKEKLKFEVIKKFPSMINGGPKWPVKKTAVPKSEPFNFEKAKARLTSSDARKAYEALPLEERASLANLRDEEKVKFSQVGEFGKFSESRSLPSPDFGAEKKSVKAYTGISYTQVNSALRQGKGSLPDGTFESTAKVVKDLDKVMARNTFTKDQVLVRGNAMTDQFLSSLGVETTNKSAEIVRDLLHKKIGQAYQDDGFMSTSYQNGGGQGFAGFAGVGKVNFRILAPKGTHGAKVSHVSNHKAENEVILDRGTKMVISDVYLVNGALWVDTVVVSSNQTRGGK